MKDILLKHGISCDLLTKEQTDKFLSFARMICEGKIQEINSEMLRYEDFFKSRERALDELKEKIAKELRSLQSEIDKILPKSDVSVLAAFSNNTSKKELEPKHTKLMQALVNTSAIFDGIAEGYLSFLTADDVNIALETELLRIAITEYGDHIAHQLKELNGYKVGEMERFSILRGNEILELKERFLAASISLDDAFNCISKASPSTAAYLSCARELLTFLHKEELLNEQKRYKNE